MSDALNQASAKYELKRKTKSVSFNVERAEGKYLYAVADALPDFSGWVKNCLSEEAKLQASGKPFLTFENAADETVAKSNYWRSRYARYGLPFLSTCNDVLRLLLPPQRVKSLVSGICAAKQVRIFSPARCGNPDYFELLFDDGSLFPFVLCGCTGYSCRTAVCCGATSQARAVYVPHRPGCHVPAPHRARQGAPCPAYSHEK